MGQNVSIVNLPTLDRRRLELKFSHLFKIVHNLYFFPNNIIRAREQTQSVALTLFTLFVSNNHLHILLFLRATCNFYLEFTTTGTCDCTITQSLQS